MATPTQSIGPRYQSSLGDGSNGVNYTRLSDDWGALYQMPDIDQVIAINRVSVGFDALMRFWKDGQPGPALPVLIGTNVLSEQARYGYERVEFKNAVPGQVAELLIIVQAA